MHYTKVRQRTKKSSCMQKKVCRMQYLTHCWKVALTLKFTERPLIIRLLMRFQRPLSWYSSLLINEFYQSSRNFAHTTSKSIYFLFRKKKKLSCIYHRLEIFKYIKNSCTRDFYIKLLFVVYCTNNIKIHNRRDWLYSRTINQNKQQNEIKCYFSFLNALFNKLSKKSEIFSMAIGRISVFVERSQKLRSSFRK